MQSTKYSACCFVQYASGKTFQHFVSTPSNTKLPKFSRISESTSVKPSVTEGQAENQKH